MTSEGGSAVPPTPITIDVEVEASDGVALVTFLRGTHNYLSYELVERLASTFEGLADKGSRAIVLSTNGRHFCAGADFGRPTSRETGGDILDLVPRLLRAPLPVVAVLTGASVGGGMGLALTADFRVMASSAYLMANFTRLGINQGFGLSNTLPRLVGPQYAAEVLYTGRRIDASTALAKGLCDRVVEARLARQVAHQLAHEISVSSPAAVAAARRILRRDLVAEIESVIALEREEQLRLMRSGDFAEGVRAWKEKRLPSFSDVGEGDNLSG